MRRWSGSCKINFCKATTPKLASAVKMPPVAGDVALGRPQRALKQLVGSGGSKYALMGGGGGSKLGAASAEDASGSGAQGPTAAGTAGAQGTTAG